MTKHTLGPWDVAANFPHGMTSICLHDGKGWQEVGTAKTEDAANLMAAAPDLLKALQEIVAAADGKGWDVLDAGFETARAAIAKAEGRA
jgi:hypothetical protein